MNINYIVIGKTNFKDFLNVLPADYTTEGDRISIGAYDDDGGILGAVSYALINYQIDVDWLYVDRAVRRQGVATSLMDQVISFASSTLEFYPISARYCMYDEREAIHEFFVSYNKMYVTYSHDRYMVSSKDIAISPYLHKTLKKRMDQRCFFDEPMSIQKRTLLMLENTGKYQVKNYDAWKKLCVRELCRCNYINNTLVSLIFIQKLSAKNLEMAFLYSKYPEGLLEMIVSVAKDMEIIYPNASLSFEAVNEESAGLARKLFPGAEVRQVFEAQW